MTVKALQIGKVGEDDMVDDEDVQNLDEASPEVRTAVLATIRDAIRKGEFKFSDEAKAKMIEKGVTEEEILAGIMQESGLDS